MSKHTPTPWKGARVRVKAGWSEAGRLGRAIGEPSLVEQEWLPILFDGEEDPTFFKLAGIERKPEDDPLTLELHEGEDYVHIYGGAYDHSENPWAQVPNVEIGQRILTACNAHDELVHMLTVCVAVLEGKNTEDSREVVLRCSKEILALAKGGA